ncbi:MAG: sensor histidine kinase [Janthinobacterium lividum]
MVACSRTSILTVDDAAHSAASHAALCDAGFDVIKVDRCDDLARVAATHHPAVAILVAPVAGAAGVDWCRRHSRPLRSGGVPVIYVENAASVAESACAMRPDAAFEPRVAALEAGAAAYLRGIDNPRELLATVRALLKLTRVLNDASERKDRFIATLAHELRAPLAPIRCAAELLRPERQSSHAAACKASEIIGRQVTHLCALIDDLLDVSRIGQGKVVLKRVHIDPLDVVQAALDIARPALERKQQRLACMLVPCGPVLFGDRVRLVQIVSNLLQNAGKYTPVGGRIAVLVHATPQRVRIAVCDNGIGIPEELLPELFDIFVQSDVALPSCEGGMGLGLPLARQLAELHGGHLHAFSAGCGRGSRFVLTLPTATN